MEQGVKTNVEPTSANGAHGARQLYVPPNMLPTQAPKPSRMPTLSPNYRGQAYCIKTNGAAPEPSYENICAVAGRINASFTALTADAMLRPDTYAGKMRMANVWGKAVRLAFHDAGETDLSKPDDMHGSDGCLSHSTDASYGLIEEDGMVNTEFEPIWQEHCDKISRADFWALIANVAMHLADFTDMLHLDYQYGRVDRHECEGGAGRLPNGQKGLAHLHDVFVTQYELTLDEAATLILGGHSLGHVHPENSGYGYNEEELAIHALRVPDDASANAWDSTPHKLDNRNAGNLLIAGWLNIQHFNGHKLSNEKNMWVPNRAGNDVPTMKPASAPRAAPSYMPTMPFELGLSSKLDSYEVMLNTDMALAFNVTTGDNPATPVGIYSQYCGSSERCHDPYTVERPVTRNITEFYSSNSLEFGEQDPGLVKNTRFLKNLADAFRKVTALGYGHDPSWVPGESITGKLGTLTTIDLDTCPSSSSSSSTDGSGGDIAPSVKPTMKPSTTKPTLQPTAAVPVSYPDQAYCKKTNGAPVVASRSNICSVVPAINASFLALTDGADPRTYDGRMRMASVWGKALRLAFHDAGEVDMSKPDDPYGADGCLSQHTDASYGLIEEDGMVNTEFEPIWQEHCDKISRADFWNLIGYISAHAADTTDMLTLDYQFGRVDMHQCEGGAGRLPDGQKGLEHIRDVFVGQYGLTMDEATTLILGGHSVGHVHPEFSGYGFNAEELAEHMLVVPEDDQANAWDSTPHKLDNRNAGNLIIAGWTNTQNFNGHQYSDTKNVWVPNKMANFAPSLSPVAHPRASPTVGPTQKELINSNSKINSREIMLNTDMALAFGINTDSPTGVMGQFCGSKETCMNPIQGDSPETRNITLFYSSNTKELGEYDPGLLINTRFLRAFSNAFRKMTATGYGEEPSWVDGESITGKLGTLTTLDLSTCYVESIDK